MDGPYAHAAAYSSPNQLILFIPRLRHQLDGLPSKRPLCLCYGNPGYADLQFHTQDSKIKGNEGLQIPLPIFWVSQYLNPDVKVKFNRYDQSRLFQMVDCGLKFSNTSIPFLIQLQKLHNFFFYKNSEHSLYHFYSNYLNSQHLKPAYSFSALVRDFH